MKITTQDVWIAVNTDQRVEPHDYVSWVDKDTWLEKHTGVIVMTKEDLEKAIGDAFIAGRSLGMELIRFANSPENSITKPNLTDYINSIIK